MRVIGWLLALPVSLLAVVFAVANRHDLRLELWPLPWGVEVPVYLAVLAPLVLGLLVGGLATWLGGHRVRMAARHHRRRAESLERQLAAAGRRLSLFPTFPPRGAVARPFPLRYNALWTIQEPP